MSDHPFQALNAALWADGLLLGFEPEARPGAPVHVVSVAIGGTDARAVHPRLLVHVDDGAEAGILLTWLAESDGPLLVNGMAEVFVDAGGRLDLLEIEAQSPTTAHVWNVSARLGRDARLAHTRVVGGLGTGLGAGLARAELDVRLDDEGAEATLDGLLLADGTRHVDVQTHMDHAKPNGTSRQLYKCILADRATTAFGGQVQVRAGAQKTNARQSNHNLLLSDTAVADAKPELEILADDVKCAHGATVGQLDEDALFYLRSRGIAPDEARAMLVRAFAGEVADRVGPEALREHARAVVRAALAVGAW